MNLPLQLKVHMYPWSFQVHRQSSASLSTDFVTMWYLSLMFFQSLLTYLLEYFVAWLTPKYIP